MRQPLYLQEKIAIFVSFLFALILMIIPIPHVLQWFWPEWLTLFVIFWVVRVPQGVGITVAWLVGLAMDITGGGLLGQHALSMSVVAFLANLLRSRIKLFPFWQQALGVLVIVGFGQLILLAEQCLLGNPPHSLLYWSSCLTSVIIWPAVYLMLNFYKNHFVRLTGR